MLVKLPVPGRPTSLDYSRARAYCACSRCGCGLFGIFSLIYHFCFHSPSLWETARYRLKYCLKGPLSPKQPTNQPTECNTVYTAITISACLSKYKGLAVWHLWKFSTRFKTHKSSGQNSFCSITHGETGLGRLLQTMTGLTLGLYIQVSGLKARDWKYV